MASTPMVGSAVTSAVNSDWLKIDTTAAERGYGPAQYGYPAQAPTAPTVPVGVNPLPIDTPEYAADSDSYQVDNEGIGAWPYLPDVYNAWDAPIQRQQGQPQGQYETTAPSEGAYGYMGAWSNVDDHGTYDYVYQSTDTEGWIQNIGNNRTSHRRTWGQANPLNNPTWYPYSENAVRTRPARLGAAFTADQGDFGVIGASNGSLPNWAMTGGQGNISYETPGPPTTTPVAQQNSYSVDPAGGWA